MYGWSCHPHRASGARYTWDPTQYFCTSWLLYYPVRAKLTSPFFTFYAWSPSCLFHGAGRGPFFCCSEGAALWPGGREARHGSTLGAGRQVQQGGEQGGSRSMQFPAAGYLHFGDWSPWELRRSHALRGIGRRTRDQSTTRGARAQRPSARSREGIKRQGADFLSRSPVLLSPLARLSVPSCCFLIGCRQMHRAAFSASFTPPERPAPFLAVHNGGGSVPAGPEGRPESGGARSR